MSSLRVLVVDDSPLIVKKLTVMLEEAGHSVVQTASNGLLAIAAFRDCRPDLVTMDITMPELDGIQATKAIMTEHPDAKIIMVTSHGQEKMILDALKAGAKGYILKPFERQKVEDVIRKACKFSS